MTPAGERARPWRVAVVGCGAIAQAQHIPALQTRTDCVVNAFVDPEPERARQAAAHFREAHEYRDHAALTSEAVDVAIVTTHNHLHAPIACSLLEEGIHVLVEKPIASSSAEARDMVASARRNGVVLAVAHMLRHSTAARWVKECIAAGTHGQPSALDIAYGFELRWPIASTMSLDRAHAGGGTLMALGPHVVDLAMWWCGDLTLTAYRDDARGGIEADCSLRACALGGAEVRMVMSRQRELGCTAAVSAPAGCFGADLRQHHAWSRPEGAATLLSGAPTEPTGRGSPKRGQRMRDLTRAIQSDFFEAVTQDRQPMTPGAEAIRSLEFIEECYRNRQELVYPWEQPRSQELPRTQARPGGAPSHGV